MEQVPNLENPDPDAQGAALEAAITAGRDGRISNQDVVRALWSSQLLSVGRLVEENKPETFQALVISAPGTDYQVAATFTTEERIPAPVREKAPVIVRASGEATIRSISSGYGLAVNPGSDTGIELAPDTVADLVEAFNRTREQAQTQTRAEAADARAEGVRARTAGQEGTAAGPNAG